MIYIQYNYKPGEIVTEEEIKNFKYTIERNGIIKLNNRIDGDKIINLFKNFMIKNGYYYSKGGLDVKLTIINIYKNKKEEKK